VEDYVGYSIKAFIAQANLKTYERISSVWSGDSSRRVSQVDGATPQRPSALSESLMASRPRNAARELYGTTTHETRNESSAGV